MNDDTWKALIKYIRDTQEDSIECRNSRDPLVTSEGEVLFKSYKELHSLLFADLKTQLERDLGRVRDLAAILPSSDLFQIESSIVEQIRDLEKFDPKKSVKSVTKPVSIVDAEYYRRSRLEDDLPF